MAVLSTLLFAAAAQLPLQLPCPTDILQKCGVPRRDDLGCTAPGSSECITKRQCVLKYVQACTLGMEHDDTSPDLVCAEEYWRTACKINVTHDTNKPQDPCEGLSEQQCAQRVACMGQIGTQCPGMAERFPLVRYLPDMMLVEHCMVPKFMSCVSDNRGECPQDELQEISLRCLFGKSRSELQFCAAGSLITCSQTDTKCVLNHVNDCLGEHKVPQWLLDIAIAKLSKCTDKLSDVCMSGDLVCAQPVLSRCLREDESIRVAQAEGMKCLDRVLSTTCSVTSAANPCAHAVGQKAECFAGYECLTKEAMQCGTDALTALNAPVQRAGEATGGVSVGLIVLVVVLVLAAVGIAVVVFLRMRASQRKPAYHHVHVSDGASVADDDAECLSNIEA